VLAVVLLDAAELAFIPLEIDAAPLQPEHLADPQWSGTAWQCRGRAQDRLPLPQ
jgi:hypothetical protein